MSVAGAADVELVARRPRHGVTLAVLAGAGLAYALQQTMVVPALPALERELDTTTVWVTWVLTGFLLSSAAATPLLGKLGDQYGKERLLVISLGIFLAGSVGATLAWDIWSLIGFRVLQGAAGAVFPLSFGIIRDEFPRGKVPVAIGIVSAVFGIGAGVGIVLSGVIVDNVSWRWIFAIGAIVIAISLVLVRRFVPESPVRSEARLDVPGALLFSGALLALLLALSEGGTWGWASTRILGLFLVSLLLFLAWVVVELRVPEPMVDMRMFVRRPVLMTNLSSLIAGSAMFGTFVLIPNFAQMPRGIPDDLVGLVDYGFGASTTKAGLYLVPSTVGMLIGGPLAGMIARRRGPKWPLAMGMALVATGTSVLAGWHSAPWQLMLAMVVLGTGIGFSFAAMPMLIADAVKQTEMGIATGLNTVMRTVGGVIGAQVAAVLITSHTIGQTTIPAASGFVAAFWLSTVAAMVALGFALLVTPLRKRPRAALEPEAAE